MKSRVVVRDRRAQVMGGHRNLPNDSHVWDCNLNGSVALSVVTVCDLTREGCGGAAG
jgi:hypothetical protein